ncbi:hypothetical protein PENTCL1PPCAC_29193, partial [Pristionchus entomophagus]
HQKIPGKEKLGANKQMISHSRRDIDHTTTLSPSCMPPALQPSPPLRENEYPRTNNMVLASKPYRGPCKCFSEERFDIKEIHNLRVALHNGICVGSTLDLPRG